MRGRDKEITDLTAFVRETDQQMFELQYAGFRCPFYAGKGPLFTFEAHFGKRQHKWQECGRPVCCESLCLTCDAGLS
jgi:hypothetical protein